MKVTRRDLHKIIAESLGVKILNEVFTGTGAFSAIASQFGGSAGMLTTWGNAAVGPGATLVNGVSGATSVAAASAETAAAASQISYSLAGINTHLATTGGGQAMAAEIATVLNGAAPEGLTYVVTGEGTLAFELGVAGAETTFMAGATSAAMVVGAILAVAAVPALALYSLSTYKDLDKRIKYIFRVQDGNSILAGTQPGNSMVSENGVMVYKPEGREGNAFDLESPPLKQLEALYPYIFTNRGVRSALRTQAEMPAEGGSEEGFALAQKVMELINTRRLDGSNLFRGYMERIIKPSIEEAERAKKEIAKKIEEELKLIPMGIGPAEAKPLPDEDKAIKPPPEEEKKKRKSGWAGYIERSRNKDQAKRVKAGFEEMAKKGQAKDATFRNWVTFYNELRNSEPDMKAIGKKKGDHMSPQNILDFYDYLQGRAPNFGSISESLSRGSLYRRRYHGRY